MIFLCLSFKQDNMKNPILFVLTVVIHLLTQKNSMVHKTIDLAYKSI